MKDEPPWGSRSNRQIFLYTVFVIVQGPFAHS
jgi:hypothetical protein